MFGLFSVTKDANKAHGFLSNYIHFARDALGIFGLEKGMTMISESEWAAGQKSYTERGVKYINFRIAVPFSSFYSEIDNDTLSGVPSKDEANIMIEGIDDFQGFGLSAFTERDLIQLWALNNPEGRASARAVMLMARFKARGAKDVSNILKGSV